MTMSCILCSGRCRCKAGNPYPPMYREREAMIERLTLAGLTSEAPSGTIRRISKHALESYMVICKTLAERWHQSGVRAVKVKQQQVDRLLQRGL